MYMYSIMIRHGTGQGTVFPPNGTSSYGAPSRHESAASESTKLYRFFRSFLSLAMRGVGLLCALLASASSASAVERVIIIADPGIDDAGAMLLALGSPQVQIEGVVAAFGCHRNVSLMARNSRLILAAANRADIPVYTGAAWPFGAAQPPEADGQLFHGQQGLGDDQMEEACGADEVSGVEFIVSTVRQFPGEITILCFSPLTNVALATVLEPRLPTLIKALLLMGGTIDAPGNVSPLAEANFGHDGASAAATFSAFAQPGAAPIVMAPLDVTTAVLYTPQEIKEIGRMGGKATAPLVAGWPTYQNAYCTVGGLCDSAPMHDAHPVAYLLDPSMFTRVEEMHVRILVTALGDPAHGMSMVDRRSSARRSHSTAAAGECTVRVLMDVDAKRFKQLMLDAIGVLSKSLR